MQLIKSIRFILVLIFKFHFISCAYRETSVVQLPQGKLVGTETVSGNVRTFKGIPYGTVQDRFQDPGPPPEWDGVLNATSSAIRCPQYNARLGLPIGKENCLVLNVHAPGKLNTKRPFPVMVLIPGEGFMSTSNTVLFYNPEPLVKKGVIVVTIYYRTGAFGYLCLKIKGAPGNAGLKDQMAALKWVKSNIDNFGGNNNSITLFGEGTGSAAVNYLMLSSDTKELFHKAIMESATALSPFAFTEEPIDRASLVATFLGYSTRNPFELLQIFRNASKNDIIMSTAAESLMNLTSYIFRPCAEKQIPGIRPFLTRNPKRILESQGAYNKVPVIIGYRENEAQYFIDNFDKKLYEKIDDNFDDLLPRNLYFSTPDAKDQLVERIKMFYFGNDTTVNEGSRAKLVNFLSDVLFYYPSVTTTEYILKTSGSPVYNYYLKYGPKKSSNGRSGGNRIDESLFQPGVLWAIQRQGGDKKLLDRMTSLWTNFAKFGEPVTTISPLLPAKWNPSYNGTIKFLILDEDIKMDSLPNPDRIQFWKDIYSEFGMQ